MCIFMFFIVNTEKVRFWKLDFGEGVIDFVFLFGFIWIFMVSAVNRNEQA